MIELTTVHECITVGIKGAIPALQTVQAYGVPDAGTALPALFHGIGAMKPDTDPGDGRVHVLATFEALLVADSPMQASELAAQLSVLLRKQFWGLDDVDGSLNVLASVVEGSAQLRWRVQWDQGLYLGEPQWVWPYQPPGTAVFGFDPDTGPGHEGDYFAPEDLT